MTTKDLNRRIVSWLVTLGEYCYTSVYSKRKLNLVPDALSRLSTRFFNNFNEEDLLESCLQCYLEPTRLSSISSCSCAITGFFWRHVDSPNLLAEDATNHISSAYFEVAINALKAFPILDQIPDSKSAPTARKLIKKLFLCLDGNMQYTITDIWLNVNAKLSLEIEPFST